MCMEKTHLKFSFENVAGYKTFELKMTVYAIFIISSIPSTEIHQVA